MSEKITDEEIEYLKGLTERSVDGMKGCPMVMSLVTENFRKDPVPVLQLGLAILMDKPLFMLFPRGSHVSESLRKIAVKIEFYDPHDKQSLRDASEALVKEARRRGIVSKEGQRKQ